MLARRSRRNPVWQPYSLLGQLSYVALYPKCMVMEPSHPSSCPAHRKCPPRHRKVPLHVHPGKLPPIYPGSRSLHRQWPHPLVPVRRRHPWLGLSTCSGHVALVTELECAVNRRHSFHFLTITLELARLRTTRVVGHCSACWVQHPRL